MYPYNIVSHSCIPSDSVFLPVSFLCPSFSFLMCQRGLNGLPLPHWSASYDLWQSATPPTDITEFPFAGVRGLRVQNTNTCHVFMGQEGVMPRPAIFVQCQVRPVLRFFVPVLPALSSTVLEKTWLLSAQFHQACCSWPRGCHRRSTVIRFFLTTAWPIWIPQWPRWLPSRAWGI